MVLSSPFFTLPVSEDRAQCEPAELLKQELGYTQGCTAIVKRGRKNREWGVGAQTKYQLQWPELLALFQALHMSASSEWF